MKSNKPNPAVENLPIKRCPHKACVVAPGPWTPSQLDQCWTQQWGSPFLSYFISLSFFFLPSSLLFFYDDDYDDDDGDGDELNDDKIEAKYMLIFMAFAIIFPPWASTDLGAPFLPLPAF